MSRRCGDECVEAGSVVVDRNIVAALASGKFSDLGGCGGQSHGFQADTQEAPCKGCEESSAEQVSDAGGGGEDGIGIFVVVVGDGVVVADGLVEVTRVVYEMA